MVITNLDELRDASSPLEFITNTTIDTSEGKEIIEQLKSFLTENKDVIAISAPQLGIKKRIFCIKFNDDVIKTFINPIITKKSKFTISPEEFYGLPGKEILISRPNDITVVYYNDDFKYEDNKLFDGVARVFVQQYELLEGILPDAYGLVSDIEENGRVSDLTEEEASQLPELYSRYIKAKLGELQDHLQDPEVKKEYDRMVVMESVITGNTEIIEDDSQLQALDKKIKRDRNKQSFRNFVATRSKK